MTDSGEIKQIQIEKLRLRNPVTEVSSTTKFHTASTCHRRTSNGNVTCASPKNSDDQSGGQRYSIQKEENQVLITKVCDANGFDKKEYGRSVIGSLETTLNPPKF
ncbi:hypothetical protein RUM43_001073 [Polyplax serrata]|uniref:Uncharacterized protein n=1 Tax=Polyplax serrata TaxID=468196 RepID=A0AAN8XQ20_POLSC